MPESNTVSAIPTRIVVTIDFSPSSRAAVESAANGGAPLTPTLLCELRAAVDVLISDVERHGKQLATID